MQQGWIIRYFTIVAIATYGYAQDLHVSIVPTYSRVSAKQDVEVTLNYQNKGSNTVFIYKWCLPSKKLYDPLFEVTRDGKPVEYLGPVAKRRRLTAEDMIPVESGKDVSSRIELSAAYNMTTTDKYSVQFKFDCHPMLLASVLKLGSEDTPFNKLGEVNLESNRVELFIEAHRNEVIERSAQVNTQVNSGKHAFIGCTSARQTLINSAIQSAKSYSANAVQYMKALNTAATARYTTWFGTSSSNNWNSMRTHFNNINTVVNARSMTFYCTCTQAGTYAYVYPSLPYTIYLCPAFWLAPTTGTDSKGGTLIHEISHFTVVAGTDDYAYGQSLCKALAKSNAAKAIKNGDSHEYFAENNPALK